MILREYVYYYCCCMHFLQARRTMFPHLVTFQVNRPYSPAVCTMKKTETHRHRKHGSGGRGVVVLYTSPADDARPLLLLLLLSLSLLVGSNLVVKELAILSDFCFFFCLEHNQPWLLARGQRQRRRSEEMWGCCAVVGKRNRMRRAEEEQTNCVVRCIVSRET